MPERAFEIPNADALVSHSRARLSHGRGSSGRTVPPRAACFATVLGLALAGCAGDAQTGATPPPASGVLLPIAPGLSTLPSAAGAEPPSVAPSAPLGQGLDVPATNLNTGVPYAFGSLPQSVSLDDAAAAYAKWKSLYYEDCGAGVARVRWDEPTQTVSEGIGYGMLLSVAHDDPSVFAGLWQYYQNNLDPNGLMNWNRGGCEGSQPTESSNNAATDGDLDVAMALLMAGCRWSDASYQAAGEGLAGLIQQFETSVSPDGIALLNPGDVFGGTECLNASYFAPGYYRAFASLPVSAESRDQWLKLAADSYRLLDIQDNDGTGLVPNWADAYGNTADSGPSGCPWYSEAHIYGTDAVRTPWRIAVDYLWWGSPEAKSYLDRVTSWVGTQGITQIGRKYELSGVAFGDIDHNVISIGAFANAAMARDASTATAFGAELQAVDTGGYFPDSLRALYLLVATGQFTRCGSL